MSQLTGFRKLACVAVLLLFAVSLSAGEKKLMHCFAFTPLAAATEADWQAFFKATDDIPAKIPVVSKVWYGKLRRPLATFATDALLSAAGRPGAALPLQGELDCRLALLRLQRDPVPLRGLPLPPVLDRPAHHHVGRPSAEDGTSGGCGGDPLCGGRHSHSLADAHSGPAERDRRYKFLLAHCPRMS